MANPIRRNQASGFSVLTGSPKARHRASEEELKLLMIQALNGDNRCYDALLRAITPLLTTFFMRRMNSRSGDVEDLVQDSLIAMHGRRTSFDRNRPFTPWLFAIARHKLIDHFRSHRSSQPIDELDDILRTEGFDDASNAQIDIDRMLSSISAKQSGAIRHTRLSGLSVAEAARTLGISESDVKISVHRGMKILASRLEADVS